MTDSIHIKFWGVRGSTPCANAENMVFGGNTTCLQIESSLFSDLLIVDCGTGLRNLGNQLVHSNEPCNGRIFITHPHWDHLQGFPFFKPFYDTKSWFRVYLPPQEQVGCKEILQGHMSNTFFPVTIDMLEADMQCETISPSLLTFDGYSVEYMWARHTINTAMFKFHIGGKVIIFAPDNELPLDNSVESKAFISEFQQFIKDADVLIHDAQFNKQQHLNRKGWGHSCWERLIECTLNQGIKKLYLTHHDPDSSDDYLRELDSHLHSEYGDGFEYIGVVREGEVVGLSF